MQSSNLLVLWFHVNTNWIVQTITRGYAELMANAEKSPSATERRDSIPVWVPQLFAMVPVNLLVVKVPYSAISPIVPETVPALHVAVYVT